MTLMLNAKARSRHWATSQGDLLVVCLATITVILLHARHSSNSLEVSSVPHGIKPHSKENLTAAEGADVGESEQFPGEEPLFLDRVRPASFRTDILWRLEMHVCYISAVQPQPVHHPTLRTVIWWLRSELPRSHAPTGRSHQCRRPPPRLGIPLWHALQETVAETSPSTLTTSSRSALHPRADQALLVPGNHGITLFLPLADTTFYPSRLHVQCLR